MTTPREALISVLEEFDPGGDYTDSRIDGWLQRVTAAIESGDSAELCDAEMYSWHYFRSEQVDPYWMRCDLRGPHATHENSDTGATWQN